VVIPADGAAITKAFATVVRLNIVIAPSQGSAGLSPRRMSPTGLSAAKQTIATFIEKASRLYEQECCAALATTALEMCVKQWSHVGSIV